MWFDQLQGNQLVTGLAVASGVGFTTYGYDQGIFGGVLTNTAFKEDLNHPDPTIQSQIVSLYYLGAILGAASSNFFGDRLGRRMCIMFACVWLTIGGILQAAAHDLPTLLVGRIVAGIGTGINTTAIPMWVVETCKREYRGRFVAFELVINNFAITIACLTNYGFSYCDTLTISWRIPLALQSVLALLTMVVVWPMPESPRFLVMKERYEEAAILLGRLLSLPAEDERVVEELRVLRENVQFEKQAERAPLKELFHNGPLQTGRRVLLGCGTGAFQQMSGINVVANYLPIVLTGVVGVSHRLSLLLSAIAFVNQVIFTSVATYLIDRVGRRKLMLIASAGQTVSYIFVAVGVKYANTLYPMAILFIFIFGCFYANGFCAIPWLYPAEINSQTFRNRGVSLSTTTNWVCVYVVTLVTPIGLDNIGWGFFVIFVVLNAIMFPIVWFYYVETKGISLEQIDLLFRIKYEKGKSITLQQARQLAIEQSNDFSPPGTRDGKEVVEMVENPTSSS